MNEELKEKIITNAWKTKFRCSTIQLLSLILEYSTTGDMKYIHKALSFMNSSLVKYNTTLIEDDFHKTKLLRNLLTSGVDDRLIIALRLFMEGERGCALWALEEFLDEHDTDSKLIAGAQ
jgi:hypothetical protein|nr:MAG TPA: hypothetical protein [Bacteriophage sp.]